MLLVEKRAVYALNLIQKDGFTVSAAMDLLHSRAYMAPETTLSTNIEAFVREGERKMQI